MFQEHGVNPLSSCLPIVLQFPFFISLFYMLRKDLRLDVCGDAIRAAGKAVSKTPCGTLDGTHGEQFFFIHDITDKAVGGVLIALIILYVGSQLVSGLITTFAADRSQQIMILVLPAIFVPVIIGFPAGLIIYWITTNFWTIGQQLAIKKFVPPEEPHAVPEGDGEAKPARGKPVPEKPAPSGKKAKPASGSSNGAEASKAAPPPGPRKKKKRSGRRR